MISADCQSLAVSGNLFLTKMLLRRPNNGSIFDRHWTGGQGRQVKPPDRLVRETDEEVMTMLKGEPSFHVLVMYDTSELMLTKMKETFPLDKHDEDFIETEESAMALSDDVFDAFDLGQCLVIG